MTDKAKWILEARDAYQSDFGLPNDFATAVATALHAKHETAGGDMPDPLKAVSDHMRSDEEPLVNADNDYPDAHTENFA